MDALAFIASLVSSLAWPMVVVIVIVLFRDPIRRMVERFPKRLKAGPLEVEWPEVAAEARVALATSPDVKAVAPEGSLTERLAKMADESPGGAIMAAWIEVERALRSTLAGVGDSRPAMAGMTLARVAHQRGLISDATLKAIEGLAVLRNLAAHGRVEEIDREKALDFLTLADAVLYAIRAGRPKS